MESKIAYTVDELHKKIIESIKNSTKSRKVGIAFSGGVDSSLLAKICSDVGYELKLLTIGFDGSHDIEFSKEIASLLRLKQEIYVISSKSFSDVAKLVRKTIESENLSWNENCIAFYYVAKLATKNNVDLVLTSNGIDELFCGYNGYREAISRGEEHVKSLMTTKLENEVQMMKVVNTISAEFNVKLIQPFLTSEFIRFARDIPIKKKIKDKDDLLRKHIIRELALTVGVPEEAALKRKKALQYGSLIHKNLIKEMKTWHSTC